MLNAFDNPSGLIYTREDFAGADLPIQQYWQIFWGEKQLILAKKESFS